MANDSQLLRGVLEGCVLKIISKRETYGYKILEILQITGFESIKEGTLYPILVRLVRKGFTGYDTRVSSIGPDRKYYFLTDLGKSELESFEKMFGDIQDAISKIWKGDSSNEE
ncbi:MAG: PadR family transcriptional regulator [Bacillota bacterium]